MYSFSCDILVNSPRIDGTNFWWDLLNVTKLVTCIRVINNFEVRKSLLVLGTAPNFPSVP